MNVLLIINPSSGKMKSKSALFDIINILSSNSCLVTTQITQKSGDAKDFSHAACESGIYDRIVCCGGDGTLSETVQGILSSKHRIPFAYIPSGSTNDFAKTFEIPTDLAKAATLAANGSAHTIDIGNFNGKSFNYIASFGAFTAVSYNAPQPLKNVLGHLAYVFEGIKDLTKIKSYPVIARTTERSYSGEYIFGAVANSLSIGGIVKLDEALVELNDGMFEVCLVKKPKNPAELVKIISGTMNSDFSSDCFEFFKTDKIVFSMPENVFWSLDGEKNDGGRSVDIRIMHNALSFIQ